MQNHVVVVRGRDAYILLGKNKEERLQYVRLATDDERAMAAKYSAGAENRVNA